MDALLQIAETKLDRFLAARRDKFPDVTAAQKRIWAYSVAQDIKSMLKDNDLFYDNTPEDVQEK